MSYDVNEIIKNWNFDIINSVSNDIPINTLVNDLKVFLCNLNDITDESQKLAYFANHTENISKKLLALKDFINIYTEKNIDNSNNDELLDALEQCYKDTINYIKVFRDSIKIDVNSTTDEVILTEDSIEDALENNDSTKNLQNDLQNLVNNEFDKVDKRFNNNTKLYGISIGENRFVNAQANSKEELSTFVTNIVNDLINSSDIPTDIVLSKIKVYEMKELNFLISQEIKIDID